MRRDECFIFPKGQVWMFVIFPPIAGAFEYPKGASVAMYSKGVGAAENSKGLPTIQLPIVLLKIYCTLVGRCLDPQTGQLHVILTSKRAGAADRMIGATQYEAEPSPNE